MADSNTSLDFSNLVNLLQDKVHPVEDRQKKNEQHARQLNLPCTLLYYCICGCSNKERTCMTASGCAFAAGT